MKRAWFFVSVYCSMVRVKTLFIISKILKKGSGTSYPGLWIEKSSGNIITYFNHKYERVILISGTNGKTTTRAMIVNALQQAGKKVCTNRGGANIYRGIATALFLDLNLLLQPKSDILVLEVEEATLPRLSSHIHGYTLLLTNIFRDQLDAYGEIDATLRFFTQSLEHAEKVMVNADDHKLLTSLDGYDGLIEGFSMAGGSYELSEKTDISFSKVVHGEVTSSRLDGLDMEIQDGNESIPLELQLTGQFNAVNALAAYAVTSEYGSQALEGISNTQPVFGRGEIIHIGDQKIFMYLVKNPAGFDRVLEFLSPLDKPQQMMMLVNDNIADGKDVSWLWDIHMEQYVADNNHIYSTGGIRGLDMLLRLEYAEAPVTVDNYKGGIVEAMQHVRNTKEDTIILATYTAMRKARMELGKYTDIQGEADAGN